MIPALSEAFLLRHALGMLDFASLEEALLVTIPYTGMGGGLWGCGTSTKNQERSAQGYEIELEVLGGLGVLFGRWDADENNNPSSSFAIDRNDLLC